MTPTDPHGHGAGALHNPEVAHETSDVNVNAIISFAAIVAVVSIVCAIIVWGVFDLLEKQAEARDPKLSPVATPAVVMPAHQTSPQFANTQTAPLLTDEPAALKQFRATENATLLQYGWTDQKAGVAHVPIEQAKKLLVERGLPARAAGADAAEGTNAPAYGEANGGRTIPTGQAAPAAAPEQAQPAAQPPAGAPAKQEPTRPSTGRGGV